MSYGLGWQADGDLGFSIVQTSVELFNNFKSNAGSAYSMGLGEHGSWGGTTLSATNAQNSDGLQDKACTVQ